MLCDDKICYVMICFARATGQAHVWVSCHVELSWLAGFSRSPLVAHLLVAAGPAGSVAGLVGNQSCATVASPPAQAFRGNVLAASAEPKSEARHANLVGEE